ncbi:ABC transporter ATP-binding protein [Gillisia sp. Hel_I_29]|uniref:ABC transporter ATP-binding protein n=1 Tax=Gillisia sp. Hel_I_29 TaxID=1249975 RepID=UPI000558384D|nr:ABC transporter ATP-binding protein [Gillisia sp. Hel_I_29]
MKKLIEKYFESLVYFYRALKYKVFIILLLSVLIGFLDGLGLTMFLPLLTMVSDTGGTQSASSENLNFLLRFITDLNIDLTLVRILLLMACFFIAKSIVVYLYEVYKVNVQQQFITKIRFTNLRRLNNLAFKYFISSDPGRIQNTMTGEVDRVARAFLTYFTAFQAGIMVVVYMYFAFTIDTKFALLVSAGGILTNFVYKKIYKNTKGASRKLTGENNVFQSLVIQHVSNFKYLKATGSISKYSNKLKSSIDKIETSNVRIGKLGAFLTASREPIVVLVVVTVIYIQTSLLGSSLGPILISLLFFYRALNFLMQMQNQWNKFLAVSGSMENMSRFSEELKLNKEEKGSIVIRDEISKIKLNKVIFKYGPNTIINGVSLDIPRHKTIAFVGESGSGKTTLVNLIAGLLPIDQGEIIINKNFISELNLTSYQSRIGYITQDPVIFNDTIFNNITFWDEKSEVNILKFTNAIKKAAIYEFVQEQEERENTLLGSFGSNLSGGQKQRISIARELYKDVEILILDEATSALDSETEKEIQKNMDNLQGDYTILIVAHRISTIKNADKIVIMNKGRIEEQGSFQELYDSSIYFKKLVSLQELS